MEKEQSAPGEQCGAREPISRAAPDLSAPLEGREPAISVSHNHRGYNDISTVYAYYTAEEKARHGKHCEHWTEFGHRPDAAPYRTGHEREFIAKVEAENPGKFASYLISWSGCD